MASIALITPPRHGRAVRWATGMPVVLEKWGFRDVAVYPLEALDRENVCNRHAAVLLPQLPSETWTPELVTSLERGRAAVLIEGPVPDVIAEAAGATAGPRLERDGSVVAGRHLTEFAGRVGLPAGGRVSGPTLRQVERSPELDWPRFSEIPIDEDLAARWREPGWGAQQLQPTDGEVLADWVTPDDRRGACVVRRGGITVCSFGLLSFLAQAHSAEPHDRSEFRSWPRTLGVEAILLGLIDAMHRHARAERSRVLPWPDGVRWGVSVRHDVDRPITRREVDTLLRLHEQAGSAATWYCRTRNVTSFRGRRALRRLASAERHEVALHAEQLWAGSSERRTLETALGRPVEGVSAHGDPGCFRWQGAPNVLWAHREGLAYTELIQQAHVHPHRFVTLTAAGDIEPLDIVCLPHHESLDRSSRGGDAATEQVAAGAEVFAASGGFLQILNHPDINQRELFDLLDGLPTGNRCDWTAAEVAGWWRSTHIEGKPAEGAVLEVVTPDGRRRLEPAG